ncbi:hypothetical protein EYF80_054152 [Liparis tanakae]|uniref:Uncharacterized protein n=1 Tax=Liparis tanakae TaxID=230148 RepID=A0A4Z2F4J2_9TELE|nr:hypothetical protein EYF80_054152 [Liparis tanakae]
MSAASPVAGERRVNGAAAANAAAFIHPLRLSVGSKYEKEVSGRKEKEEEKDLRTWRVQDNHKVLETLRGKTAV